MKLSKPDYFDEIHDQSEIDWILLEQRPKIASPWKTLFNQVKDPRHVISELLQNADDTEASECSVELKDDVFTFTHNGKDFSTEDFVSLCQFGYSRKRLLHTIGFRGIGFKSTFSLGDIVELNTPTLSVYFHSDRFTLPVWSGENYEPASKTQVIVRNLGGDQQNAIANNIQIWKDNPLSLLFFNHIRHLTLGVNELMWGNAEPGPTNNSIWMRLNGGKEKYLSIRSQEEPFPEEAIDEIRKERILHEGEELVMPPCRVEIVLGAQGKLYAVLPTELTTALPFAINAPFILDPARINIKDPGVSFTNRWLLKRIGILAADAMISWLQNEDLTLEERAQAYELFPIEGPRTGSLVDDCEKQVVQSFLNHINEKAYVLSDRTSLEKSGTCYSFPKELRDVWTADQILSIFKPEDKNSRLVAKEISESNRQKLLNQNAIKKMQNDKLIDILIERKPPKPKSWHSLLILWQIVSDLLGKNDYFQFNIFPVRGDNVLYSSLEVIRLGEKALLKNENDWMFLSKYLRVVDPSWFRFITKYHRINKDNPLGNLKNLGKTANQILTETNLKEVNDASTIIDTFASEFFLEKNISLEDCIRVAQISAKLNATLRDSFQFVTNDDCRRTFEKTIYSDENGALEKFIPPELRAGLLLHSSYWKNFTSCSHNEWKRWIQSGNSGLKTYLVPAKGFHSFWELRDIEGKLREHGCQKEISSSYNADYFVFFDVDFNSEYWEYWSMCAKDDPSYWCELAEIFLTHPSAKEYYWKPTVTEVIRRKRRTPMYCHIPWTGWALKFRELPCLRDTRGKPCKPVNLMRRTPQTEALLGMEPFVDGMLDTEATRHILEMFGVRSTPISPKQVIERIRALSKAEKPPLDELDDLYCRLDMVHPECSTEDQLEIRNLFADEKLIFSEEKNWETSTQIFIYANLTDAPGVPVIHSKFNSLSIWTKLGVNEHPTKELALNWLASLPSRQQLTGVYENRVQAMLRSYTREVWQSCGHWINLLGEWVPVEDLEFALNMQSLISCKSLFPSIKKQTADFQMLSFDAYSSPPFNAIPSLWSRIEKRLEDRQWVLSTLDLAWLHSLANILEGIILEDEDQTEHVRCMAKRMQSTTGEQVDAIRVVPYIDGVPVGEPQNSEIAWVENTLFVTNISKGKLSKQIPDTISDPVNWAEMREILAYCYNRNEEDIREYMQDNYRIELVVSTQEQLDKIQEQVLADTNVPVSAGTEEIEWLEPAGYSSNEEPRTIPVLPVPEVGGGNVHSTPKPHPPKPVHVALIERYARAHGYSIVNEHKFKHPNGNVLQKSDDLFPWQLIDSEGEVVCYYWVREHCLEQKALEIPYEIWHGMENDPDRHAFILEDFEGNPTTMTGKRLLTLKQNGNLTLSPAAYRLNLIYKDT